MAGMFKGYAQTAATEAATVDQIQALDQGHKARETTGPAGGLLIAVGTSLLLWAAIAQCARWASAILF